MRKSGKPYAAFRTTIIRLLAGRSKVCKVRPVPAASSRRVPDLGGMLVQNAQYGGGVAFGRWGHAAAIGGNCGPGVGKPEAHLNRAGDRAATVFAESCDWRPAIKSAVN